MSHLPEKDIIVFIQNEKFEAAINSIVENYSDRLYAHVIRMVKDEASTQDVLQNTFVKIWKGLAGFRQESKLSTWLFTIATNESFTFLKKQKRISTSMLSINQEATSMDGLDGNQIEMKLKNAIETLPLKQKQVFILRYFDEVKYKDMSEMLDTSEGALKASYHHAVKKIESFLKED
ncbi:MAG: RNA polymerase sigma factor (sigma-70 family) [Chitinophagales bacterium]